jgi:3-phenylpropionate/trans-cinnamate dioxygenase ferredoxin reductase subunit
MDSDTFVIVGAGLAGAKTAEALRTQGFSGSLTLIGEEPHLPYERPPLSKDFLAGKAERDNVFVHTPDWYAEHRVELRLGVAVTALDPAGHTVTLADGDRLDYTKLMLATGSSPRPLPIPGADATGVHYLRRIEDAERIRDLFGVAHHLVVIGAGWIGLEVTAAARQAGLDVTVLESLELPLLRVLGPETAQVFADLHTAHGVRFRYGVRVTGIRTDAGRATGVLLADGTVLDADAVVVGIGAAPNTGPAERAGLAVDNGVLVDATLRTSDPDVFAAGDIAHVSHPVLGRRVRVEHWAAAINQPPVAAAGMLGEPTDYTELPYFYTDQKETATAR